MIRVTDQYFWNVVFSIFFLTLVVLGVIILDSGGYRSLSELTLLDYVLMSLASWRLIRLFVYDAITKFFREQFYDAQKVRGGGIMLTKPATGPRRTLADLLSCPWCFGIWASAVVVFCYVEFAWAVYPVTFLAIAAIATFMQLVANLIGHRAEQLKLDTEQYR